MAAELSVHHLVTLTIDGAQHPGFGSLVETIKGSSASIDDGGQPILRRVKVPASSNVVAWEWADTSGFTHMTVRIVGGEGFVQMGVRYNSPTSSTDLTPTGSTNHWKDRSVSCVGVVELDTERAYIHATAATEVGDTGGVPTVWSSGSRSLGVADKVAFLNEGTDDVTVEMIVVPK